MLLSLASEKIDPTFEFKMADSLGNTYLEFLPFSRSVC